MIGLMPWSHMTRTFLLAHLGTTIIILHITKKTHIHQPRLSRRTMSVVDVVAVVEKRCHATRNEGHDVLE
jgi:hypothetical protein